MARAQYPPGSNHVQHRSPFDPGERWFSAKWSWFVATYEARHQAGQARGDGSLGPVSRADHPVATWYNRRGIQQEAQAADLDLGSVRYTQVCAYAKNKACAPRSPRRRERFTPSWPPLSPSSLTWRGAFFVQRIVHPPYAAHNSSANDFHRTELFSHGIRLNPLFPSSSLVAWWIDTSWGLLLSLLTRIYLHFDFNCWYPSSLYTGYVRSNKN